MKKNLFISALFFLCLNHLSGQIPGIVPAPVTIIPKSGEFFFGPGTALEYETLQEKGLAGYFAGTIGIDPIWDHPGYLDSDNRIVFRINESADLPAEGYTLTVNPEAIVLTGRDRGGLLYAVQTLIQLLPADLLAEGSFFHTFTVPCVEITDYPRFGYRGFSFDVARTFSGKETVLQLLDRMAFHKLNRLHWHLTDDEGWRIELDSHPRLAEVGGFRGGESPVRNIYGAWGETYGGYFTKDEIREVVSYASFLNIEVIPEFDIPGHSRAFARVYPEILCRGHVDSTAAGYDMRKVWCAGREENFTLIEEIIEELCGLFPGAMIHTGGDEVPPEQWEACPDCKAIMKREGFDTKGLNTWFENRVGKMVRDRGRRQVVWNEAVDGGFLDKAAVISAWENEGSVLHAVKKGFPTVAMPSQFCYFDMKQSAGEVGLAWAGIIGLQKVYEYEPVPKGYSDDAIMGIEVAFWTETYLWNGEWWMDYQLFPRLCALSERMWSPSGRRDFAEFESRLKDYHLARLTALGVGYRGSEGIKYARGIPSNRINVKYTLTGSVPATSKNPYSLASDGNDRTFARTVRTPLDGDWFEFLFDKPVKCGSVTIKTGYNAIPRFVVGPALLEVSYDGDSYTLIDNNFGYTGTFHPTGDVHKIRLTVKGDGNGEEAAIIYDLIVEP